MRRREFIGVALAGTLTALPTSARAQQPLHTPDHWPKRHYSIAVISPAAPLSRMTETSPNLFFREFFLEIRRRGYVEGENLHVHRFSTEGNPQRTPEVIQQAIQSQPDAIFAFSSRLVKALKDATTTVPVIGYTADPISFGIVTNLSQPGGNVTGVSTEAGPEFDGKRLALFKEMAPTASRLAVLAPSGFWMSPYGSAIRALAGQLGFEVVGGPLADPSGEAEFRMFFANLERNRAEVVLIPDASENNSNLRLVVELVERMRLPAIASSRQFVEAGILMSYAADPADLVRRAAAYVDQVLRGAKPSELPFLQPTRFEFVVNAKAAKALGLTIPLSVIASADEVIE